MMPEGTEESDRQFLNRFPHIPAAISDLVEAIIDAGKCPNGPELEQGIPEGQDAFIECGNSNNQMVADVTEAPFGLLIATVICPSPGTP